MKEQKSPWTGYLLLATAALTCPCHLPLLMAILGGTALAGFPQQNLALTLIALTAYFLFTLLIGLKLIGWERSRTHREREVGRFSST